MQNIDCNCGPKCDCVCYCNSSHKRCYQGFIIFFSIFIFVFQLATIILTTNSLNPEEFESIVLSETPLYDFEISEEDINNKQNIIFFKYKGRKKKEGLKTVIYDKKNFTKIFNNKFFYKGKNKNYFDYIHNYTVSDENNCTDNYKQCGILDSDRRILCLPNDEECPINGFWISDEGSDPKYEGYKTKKVYDSIDNSEYYIYYTNNNTKGKIITEFKLSAGTPCKSSSDIFWDQYYDDEVEKYIDYCQSGTSYEYFQVSYGIIQMKSLFKDNGLTDPPNNQNYKGVGESKVYLFSRNYIVIKEKCFKAFLENFNNEKKYYDVVVNVIRVLGVISLAMNIAIIIYMFSMCCCHLKFSSISFIEPIYGILWSIIMLSLLTKERLRYICHEGTLNDEMDEIIGEQYDQNKTANIVFSSLSLAFYFIVFIFILCLKCAKNENNEGVSTSGAPVQVNPAQPVYPQALPVLYSSKRAFQNIMAPSGSY